MVAAQRFVERDILPVFMELGETIRTTWSKYHYTEDALVDTAAITLDKFALHKQISPEDLIDYSLNPNPITSAHQFDSPFGDLQQILYRHSRFYIEALYWCDGTTAIHDHGFSGAFYVMSGSSINAEYQFHDAERINHHFWFGELSKPKISELQVGSVKKIYSGKRFIHSVFHLENPTVSIVVRTFQDDDAMPQFEYRGNKIRLVQELIPEFAKKIKGLRFALAMDEKKFIAAFARIYHESPFDERYWLLRAFYSSFTHLSCSLTNIIQAEDDKTKIILESIKEEAMIYKAIQLRNAIKDPDLRYFLALLLNLSSWKEITRFIKNRYVNSDEILANWLEKIKTQGYEVPIIQDINQMPKDNEFITNRNVLCHLISKRMQFL